MISGKQNLLTPAAFLLSSWALCSCGYALKQGGHNLLFDSEGVQTVYIEPFVNNSYKPGVENLVFNQVQRAIAISGNIRLVSARKEADAVLSGSVSSAGYGVAGSTFASGAIFPNGRIEKDSSAVTAAKAQTSIATSYSASLSCSFQLVKRPNRGRKPVNASRSLWGGGFSRSIGFPANNQLGIFGTTSHLINESEYERALKELAERVSFDLTENMFSMF